MVEDAILAAVNEAFRQIDEMVNSEIGKLTGGIICLNRVIVNRSHVRR